MKSTIIKVLNAYIKLKMCLKWRYELNKLQQNIHLSEKKESLPYGKYLILIPHSDDEWIGSSTIISNENYEVTLINMDRQGNDKPHVHLSRYKEMKCLADKYRRELITAVDENGLISLINRLSPIYILIPSFIDWHSEHVELSEMLLKISDKINSNIFVGMYQVTVPFIKDNITHINVLDKRDWKHKWKVFKYIYKTQFNFPWYRVACNEKLQGMQFGVYAAEVFTLLKLPVWANAFKKYKLNIEDMSSIKASLASLISIRNIDYPQIIK